MSTRALDRLAYAHDASHYLIVPASFAVAESVAEVAQLMVEGLRRGVPVTFRSGVGEPERSGAVRRDSGRHP